MNATTLNTTTIDQDLLTAGRRNIKAESKDTDSEVKKKWWRFSPQKILYSGFYLTLAIASFFVFLIPKLPYSTMSQSALNYLSIQTPFIWKSDTVNTSFLFGPSIEFIKLSLTSKTFGAEEPHVIALDSLSLSPNIFSSLPIPGLMAASPSASFKANSFGGQASGWATTSGQDLAFKIAAEKLKLEKLAPALQMAALDPKGMLQELSLQLAIPQAKLARSNGSLLIKLKNFQLDPGGLNLGMPIPILTIGDAVIQGTVKNGHFTFNNTHIGGPSYDAELFVDGDINLRDPLEFSEMDLKMRIKFAPKIVLALPYLDSFLATGKRSDGFYGLKLSGNLAAPGIPQPYSGN